MPMGGILGLWNRDGRPVDAGLLHRLGQTLAHRPGVQTIAAPSGADLQVAFDGRLDNRDELLARLDRTHRLDAASPDHLIAAAAYRTWGTAFAGRLEGDFAVAVFDPAERRLVLARDALGVRPLHYFVARDLVLVASEIRAILAHPSVTTSPNEDVLADYLINLFADDATSGATFFSGIHSVPPSYVVRVTADAVEASRYWDFDPSITLPIRTIDEAAEGFREQFTRAVGRRIRSAGPVAISVSGGLDSSAIFCVAERASRHAGGPPIVGCSYTVADGSPSDEKRYLTEIEQALGVSIHRWSDLPTGTLEGSRDGIRHLEVPALDTRWTGTLAYYRAIRDLGATTVLTGHWGDQFLVQDGFFADLARDGRWLTVARTLAEYRHWQGEGAGDVWRNVPRTIVRELLPARALAGVRRVKGAHVDPDRAAWFTSSLVERALAVRHRVVDRTPRGRAHARGLYRQARSGYHVFGMEWHHKLAAMHGMDAAFPFLDRQLIAFLMAIPGEFLTWQGRPKGLLRVALRDALPQAIAERRSKADFSEEVNAETVQDYDKLVAQVYAGGQAVARGYLRRAATDAAARLAEAETCTLSWAITDVLALELWLEEFFGDRTEASDHA